MLLPKVYPGWTGRFYIDDTIPLNIREGLLSFDHVEVYQMPTYDVINVAMMWRFLAAADDSVAVMISRDADSWLCTREAVCVQEWLDSDKGFHIIRDHCYHSHKVMAGMWGIKRDTLSNMRELLDESIRSGRDYDQSFLAEVVYPLVKENMLVHYAETQKKRDGSPSLGYHNDGGVPFPKYELVDEQLPGLSFREIGMKNLFRCAHCKRIHLVYIGGIMENIPEGALDVVRNYMREKGIDIAGI